MVISLLICTLFLSFLFVSSLVFLASSLFFPFLHLFYLLCNMWNRKNLMGSLYHKKAFYLANPFSNTNMVSWMWSEYNRWPIESQAFVLAAPVKKKKKKKKKNHTHTYIVLYSLHTNRSLHAHPYTGMILMFQMICWESGLLCQQLL